MRSFVGRGLVPRMRIDLRQTDQVHDEKGATEQIERG